MPITIKRNASEHKLEVTSESGLQTWDLSQLNSNQMSGVREMVVNDWCRRNGFPALFEGATK